MNYALNFVIPQGPTGPTGPTGAKGENGTTGLNAYGGKYNSTNARINLGIATPAQIPLISNMPSYNLSYSSTNGIVILQTGVYEVSYYVSFTITNSTLVNLNVRQNNSNIANLVITQNLTAGTNYVYSGSTIMDLTENDVITLSLTTEASTTVVLNAGNGASLIIKKVN